MKRLLFILICFTSSIAWSQGATIIEGKDSTGMPRTVRTNTVGQLETVPAAGASTDVNLIEILGNPPTATNTIPCQDTDGIAYISATNPKSVIVCESGNCMTLNTIGTAMTAADYALTAKCEMTGLNGGTYTTWDIGATGAGLVTAVTPVPVSVDNVVNSAVHPMFLQGTDGTNVYSTTNPYPVQYYDGSGNPVTITQLSVAMVAADYVMKAQTLLYGLNGGVYTPVDINASGELLITAADSLPVSKNTTVNSASNTINTTPGDGTNVYSTSNGQPVKLTDDVDTAEITGSGQVTVIDTSVRAGEDVANDRRKTMPVARLSDVSILYSETVDAVTVVEHGDGVVPSTAIGVWSGITLQCWNDGATDLAGSWILVSTDGSHWTIMTQTNFTMATTADPQGYSISGEYWQYVKFEASTAAATTTIGCRVTMGV